MKKIYVFGKGNISWEAFECDYLEKLKSEDFETTEFMVGDFRGTDTLMMEWLKEKSEKVTVLHLGEKPRYFPDIFKTKVSKWTLKGGFLNDKERDLYGIEQCTHFLGIDYNSDENRKSGTQKNIEKCLILSKIKI